MSKRYPPDNLGMRQRALNARVKEAFVNNVKFEDLEDTAETSEVDKLFKIDLAAKYKHVDYILEMLKSADSLYTTRALKRSLWLFNDEYRHIINPEYLHNNIFPHTSLKMKRKILSDVSLHVRSEDRATLFYSYCVNTKLLSLALKFVLFTSESFKLALLQENKPPANLLFDKDKTYLNNFLKRSFPLYEALLKIMNNDDKTSRFLHDFQCWYNYDSEKYLDLVEKYGRQAFDQTYSKNIMEKQKLRVLAKPEFYINIIHRDAIVKYSTAADAKIYAVALLPKNYSSFWDYYYYASHKYVLDIIPKEDIYAFLKKNFHERYPGKEFETSKEFYDQKYYMFMTKEEQEAWAWEHIKSEKQILGVGRDYIWYGFVNFNDAFDKIKNLILIRRETSPRYNMLITLIRAAKTNRELEKLFEYYHKKHLNEARNNKEQFLLKVIEDHNIFDFDESCWKSFHILLFSMDLYNKLDHAPDALHVNDQFKTVLLLYHIVNEKEIPDPLMQYALDDFETVKIKSYLDKLTDKKRNILYEYLHSMFTNKVLDYKNEPFTSRNERQVKRYFNCIVWLMKIYNEKLEPTKRNHYRPERKKRCIDNRLSDRELLRRLKMDSNLVMSALPEVMERFEIKPFKINTFLKKVKLYFSDDISNEYLQSFERNVNKNLNMKGIDAAVNGIFHLADEKYKISFMNKHAPKNNRVDYNEIDPQELRVQKAICRYFCRSRPPMPLENILMYLKGDYVKHCLHIFNMFLQKLSTNLCLNFIESILDSPVSLQKHGIRLAFACFDTENLKKLITNLWKKSKNVSLRGILYKILFKKVKDDHDKELFEVLKYYTIDLRDDDENEIFDLLVSEELPGIFLSDYNEAAWTAVGKFRDRKEPNIQRIKNVLRCIRKNLTLMDELFVRTVVVNHLEEMFKEKRIYDFFLKDRINNGIFVEKWKLVEAFIIHATSFSQTPTSLSVTLSNYVTQACLESWKEVHHEELIYQKLFFQFVKGLKKEGHKQDNCDPINAIPVFETIITELQKRLSLVEIYIAVWDLKLTIVYKKVTHNTIIDSTPFIQFGRQVGEIIVDYVRKKQYNTYMSNEIKHLIEGNVEDLHKKARKADICISAETGLILVASGLTEHETVETYVLAVQLLPSCGITWDSYKTVISKVSQMEEPNVQCAIHLNEKRLFM
ncbi:unnamed protein product [Chilo suppressalis]|uniref:Uncharacterized protein n=1 Tax=Chilo suppressalis TaxID=168631 RepID=A0ABN8L4Z2_CHISP|nr:unnamed protein product [Chilo suppressalis]